MYTEAPPWLGEYAAEDKIAGRSALAFRLNQKEQRNRTIISIDKMWARLSPSQRELVVRTSLLTYDTAGRSYWNTVYSTTVNGFDIWVYADGEIWLLDTV